MEPPVSVEDEASHLIQLYGGDAAKVMGEIERQLGILMGRAQTLLSLAGLTITVTGFSGEAIARVGAVAKASISAGIVFVLAAAVTAIVGVLRVRWLTQELDDDVERTLLRAIEIRDRKTASLKTASWLFVVGFSLYCAAIAQLLLHAR